VGDDGAQENRVRPTAAAADATVRSRVVIETTMTRPTGQALNACKRIHETLGLLRGCDTEVR
jgi:hypothetical protein